MEAVLRIGTRRSPLALCQAEWVRERLREQQAGIEVILKKIKTSGDKILDVPLAQVGGKGLFVKEIEEALLSHEIDLAVHSMKDVPVCLPEGLHLRTITQREDPRDVLISANGEGLAQLPKGARIGTSSLRRQSQLLHFRPDFEVVGLRGNLDTRIRKLREDGLNGIVLAAAGLKRMGWLEHVTEYLSPEILLPAVGQGSLGIENREDDADTDKKIQGLNHPQTQQCVEAERAFLRRLEGSCQVPIAGYGLIRKGRLQLRGMIASLDGSRLVQDAVSVRPEDGESAGIELAERLLSHGGKTLLDQIYEKQRLDH